MSPLEAAILLAVTVLALTSVDAIIVKNSEGSTFSLDVPLSDTVESVKSKLFDHWSVPPEAQRLVFAGKEMEDLRFLSDYNVQQGSTLTMVLHLRGVGPGTNG